MTPDLATMRAQAGEIQRRGNGRPIYPLDLKLAVGASARELGAQAVSDAIGVNRSTVKAWSLGYSLGLQSVIRPAETPTGPRPIARPLPVARCPRCRADIVLGDDEVRSYDLRTALVLRHMADGCAR